MHSKNVIWTRRTGVLRSDAATMHSWYIYVGVGGWLVGGKRTVPSNTFNNNNNDNNILVNDTQTELRRRVKTA